MELICTDSGVIFYDGEEWIECSYGNLPVWGAIPAPDYPEAMIVVMGNGTDSDGIYLFACMTQEFMNLYWLLHPRFIQCYQEGSAVYAGGGEGLIRSEDGLVWEPVTYFNGMNCYTMACYGENLVVGTETDVHYSLDGGINWAPSQCYLWISDLAFDQNGILYGIFPDGSYSSGLWSSNNGGQNWDIQFWYTGMSSVWIDFENNVFVGWEEESQGVAMYMTDIWELVYFNEGLPDLTINNICCNPLIDCNNIVACTNDGVHLLTDYSTSTGEKNTPPRHSILYNSPNPFRNMTVISFLGRADTDQKVEIFNLKGQLVRVLDLNDQKQAFWN
jgi:hypothetical protein